MASSGNAGNRQPKFPICTNPDLRRRQFDVLRHSGVKIEAYSVAQAGENQRRLRSVDVAVHRPGASRADAAPRAYVLADNKLALNAGWDLEMLALEIGELGE